MDIKAYIRKELNIRRYHNAVNLYTASSVCAKDVQKTHGENVDRVKTFIIN